MNPDTEQPFTLDQLAQGRRRRDGLIAGIAAGAVLLAAAGIALAAATGRWPADSAAAAASPSPSPYIIPTAVSPIPVSATPADVASPAAPPRSPSQTCSDSAAWDQEGGTELIDGYINNQDTGNINIDDIKAECPQYLPVWQRAQGGIPGGSSFAVPSEVKPGTYETTSNDLENCYWERSRKGQIVDNRFITASKVKQRVTIRSTDDTFVTRDCGNWIRVS